MGSAEGLSPFAGSLRVSLRYNFFPFIPRKGARGMFERVFQRPAREMSRWFPVVALAVLTMAVACSRAPAPRLLVSANGLEIGAFESKTLDISGEGAGQMVISNADIALDHISVEVRDTVGRTRIEVPRLLGEPVQNSPASIGDVFQYVEVALEGIEDAEIRSVTLSFAVPNRWLDANGHEPDAITLARLSDGWIPLTTWVNGQSRSHTRFRAVSSGLSLFAIVASRSPAASGPSLPRGFRPLQTTRVLTATPAQGVPSPPTHTTRPIVPVAVPTVLPSPIAEAEATVGPISAWIPASPPNPTPDSPAPVATVAVTVRLTPSVTPVPTPEATATATPEASATATPSPTATSDASLEPTGTASPTPSPPPPAATPDPTPTPSTIPTQYDDRFGVVLHSRAQSDNAYFLDQLGVRWYLDLESDMSQVPPGASKVAYLRVPVDATEWGSEAYDGVNEMSDDELAALGVLTAKELEQMAAASPGTSWYTFGEPNKYGFITGARFAPMFHHLSSHIRAGDPTAKIVSPSLLNWDWTCYQLCYYEPGKNWIAGFISAYESRYGAKPDVDAWAIDTYPIDWVRTPNAGVPHAQIVIDQITGLRDYLATIPEYATTPIWITEISLHVGYDGWAQDPPGSGNFVPVGDYHWDGLSDYIIRVLDWLEANSSSKSIERWFFYKTWRDVANASTDGYMGISFLDGPDVGAALNCLGETYRHRALGLDPVRCDATGATVPAG